MKAGRAMANAISILFSCPRYTADPGWLVIRSLDTGGKAALQC